MSEPPPSSGDVDYAVPAAVPLSRRRAPRAQPTPGALWGGRARTGLIVGCWVGALVLALLLVVPVVTADETGADSPEAAVAQLLQGIADVDPVAIVESVDPEETDDPQRASDAYQRMSGRLLRQGEVPPADVTAVLAAAEGQVGGSLDLTSVALLAAVDLTLDDLVLRSATDPSGGTRVYVDGGTLDVALDPARLPDSVDGIGRATYSMPLADGWRRDRSEPFDPFLVTVERDGRWYVSLEASADALLDRPGRTR